MYRKFLPQFKSFHRYPSPDLSDSDSIPAFKPVEEEPDTMSSFSREKGKPIPPFNDFLSPDPIPVTAFVQKHEPTPAEETASNLRETQRLFAKGTPDHGGDHCTALDRLTVLEIYAQALDKLSSAPEEHVQIAVECARKVRIVLSTIDADPDDTVFSTLGQLLSPLEPLYANPRIDRGDDQYGYRAQWRLHAWRKEGWPKTYPLKAVEREARITGEGLVGKGKMSDKTIKKRMLSTNEMWEDGDKALETASSDPTEKTPKANGEGSRTERARTMMVGPYRPNADDDGELLGAEDRDMDDIHMEDAEDDLSKDAEDDDLTDTDLGDLDGEDDDWS